MSVPRDSWSRQTIQEPPEFLARLRAHDPEAFEQLVTRYHPTFLRLARSYTRDAGLVEEIAQETWLAVLRGVENFEGRSSLETWMFSILFNRARSIAAKERRVPSSDSNAPEDSSGAGRSDPDADTFFPDGHSKAGKWKEPVSKWPNPERLLLSHELHQNILREVDELSPRLRETVTLRDLEGLQVAEASALLGITENAFRVRLHRGRTQIRQRLEEYLSND